MRIRADRTAAMVVGLAMALALASPAGAIKADPGAKTGSATSAQHRLKHKLVALSLRNATRELVRARINLQNKMNLLDKAEAKGGLRLGPGEASTPFDTRGSQALADIARGMADKTKILNPKAKAAKRRRGSRKTEPGSRQSRTQRKRNRGTSRKRSAPILVHEFSGFGGTHKLIAPAGMPAEWVTAPYDVIMAHEWVRTARKNLRVIIAHIESLLKFDGSLLKVAVSSGELEGSLRMDERGGFPADFKLVDRDRVDKLPQGTVLFDVKGVPWIAGVPYNERRTPQLGLHETQLIDVLSHVSQSFDGHRQQ